MPEKPKPLPRFVCAKFNGRLCNSRKNDGACRNTGCQYNVDTSQLTIQSLSLLTERIIPTQ